MSRRRLLSLSCLSLLFLSVVQLTRAGGELKINESLTRVLLQNEVAQAGSLVKVIEAFARQHTPLNITLELATIETIKRFVQKRVGLAFVPRMCVREELDRGVLVSVAAFLNVLRSRAEAGASSILCYSH